MTEPREAMSPTKERRPQAKPDRRWRKPVHRSAYDEYLRMVLDIIVGRMSA